MSDDDLREWYFRYAENALRELDWLRWIRSEAIPPGALITDGSGNLIEPDDPILNRWYVCPQCFGAFPHNAIAVKPTKLTLEHVPPEAVGGKKMVLTCRECNEKAGTWLDSHIAKVQKVKEVFTGMPKLSRRKRPPLRGRVYHDNQPYEAEFDSGDNAILMVLSQSDSVSYDGIRTRLESKEELKLRFEFDLDLDLHAERVGWLRAAYLAAFALFGYRYIAGRDLRLVRQQIKDHSAILIPHFSAMDQSADPSIKRIYWLNSPTFPMSLAVQMNQRLVFLPFPGGAPGFYDKLAEFAGRDRSFSESGKSLGWPTEPSFPLDPSPEIGAMDWGWQPNDQNEVDADA